MEGLIFIVSIFTWWLDSSGRNETNVDQAIIEPIHCIVCVHEIVVHVKFFFFSIVIEYMCMHEREGWGVFDVK